jgi:hypothetical protein
MATTNHLAITLLEQSQAQKDVTVNEALARIDAVLNTAAIDLSISTPPVSPSEGDLYIVAASATGDWAGQEDNMAYFDGSVWRFVTPKEGMRLWVADEYKDYIYFGGQWTAETNHWRGYDQSQYHNLKALTDAANISWDARYYPVAEVTLEGNRTLDNPTNVVAGAEYRLIVRQDATGSRTLSFDTGYAFAGGSAPTLSTAANAVDLLGFLYDGSKMLGTSVLNLS